MTSEVSCPPAETLRQLLLGQLAGPDAERWLLHLETCPVCLRSARGQQASDPLVEALRCQEGSPPGPTSDSDESVFLLRIQDIGPPGGGASSPLPTPHAAGRFANACP